jgi:hypothetical protein
LTVAAAVLVSAVLSCGCLVLSLHPIYDDRSIAWDESLLGEWRADEDNIDVTVERGEWRSFRIRYKRPADEGEFTAHLSAIGETYYLDLMTLRGQDHGPVLIPGHMLLRLTREDEGWQVSGLDYDRARARATIAAKGGPSSALDQRQYVVLTGPTSELRRWLGQAGDEEFSAPALFKRVSRPEGARIRSPLFQPGDLGGQSEKVMHEHAIAALESARH